MLQTKKAVSKWVQIAHYAQYHFDSIILVVFPSYLCFAAMDRTDSSAAMSSLLNAYGGDEEEDAPIPSVPSEVDNISDEDDDTPNPRDVRIVQPAPQPDKRPRSFTPDPNPKPAKKDRKGEQRLIFLSHSAVRGIFSYE